MSIFYMGFVNSSLVLFKVYVKFKTFIFCRLSLYFIVTYGLPCFLTIFADPRLTMMPIIFLLFIPYYDAYYFFHYLFFTMLPTILFHVSFLPHITGLSINLYTKKAAIFSCLTYIYLQNHT